MFSQSHGMINSVNNFIAGDKVRNGEETSRSSETALLRIRVGAPAKDLARAKKAEISQQRDRELALFTFSSIEVATDYFAPRNKLGEGGFGPVYKASKAYNLTTLCRQ